MQKTLKGIMLKVIFSFLTNMQTHFTSVCRPQTLTPCSGRRTHIAHAVAYTGFLGWGQNVLQFPLIIIYRL